MADQTNIEWTDSTWTPIRARRIELQNDGGGQERIGWHCEKISPGCKGCYAEGMNNRLGTGMEFKPANLRHVTPAGDQYGDVSVFLDEAMLLRPLHWKRPRMIFVCSMTDIFADFVRDEWIDQIFAVMARCPQHTFQVLTKRPERMRDYFNAIDLEDRLTELWRGNDIDRSTWNLMLPLKNVWLGVSAENQEWADKRIPILLQVPAAVRFLSMEPLLGPVDISRFLDPTGITCMDVCPDSRFVDKAKVETFTNSRNEVEPICQNCGLVASWTGYDNGIDWVIVGGESGPGARPMHPDWARSLRAQCAADGVPFLFKQWGEWSPLPTPTGTYARVHPVTGAWHTPTDCDGSEYTHAAIWKGGKKASGRMLDGVQHDGFPEIRT